MKRKSVWATLLCLAAVAILALATVPAVARAGDIVIRGSSSGTVTVTTSDEVILGAGWLDAYKAKDVAKAAAAYEYRFSVYASGESVPLYSGDTQDGTWTDVFPVFIGPQDALYYIFWHPRWPKEAFQIDWRYRLGQMAPGDYDVTFAALQTKTLRSWANSDYDGNGALDGHGGVLPKWKEPLIFNFTIHVVPG